MVEIDGLRRCMPLAEWPLKDQMAWQAANQQGGILDDNGLAAHWRPDTKRSIIAAYGRYLTFLDVKGWLERTEGPASRLSPDHLRAYIAELQTQVASVTVQGRIVNLSEALRVMVPGGDYPYLHRAKLRLKQRSSPIRNKRARIVSAHELLELGKHLMHAAETGTFRRLAGRACAFRDGVIICLLVCRPVRRKNFASMTLDQHLVHQGDRYLLHFDAEATKSYQTYKCSFDPAITPYIERYLEQYRPILLKAANTKRLWISMGGYDLGAAAIYGIVTSRTKAAFGRSICPHLFRDCAVTSLGQESPEHVWASLSVLGNSDPRTVEKHYDQASSEHALRKYQRSIQRRRLKSLQHKKAS